MSQNNIQNSHPRESDEIDLLQLFRGLGNWVVKFFKGLFNFLLQILIFSLKNWLYLILSVILGIVFSFLLAKVQQDLYYSDLILKSNAVENQEMISYINRLDNLSTESLAAELDLSTEDADNIDGIHAYWFIDRNMDGIVEGADLDNRFLADTTVDKVDWKFGIRASVTDPNVLSKITKGISSYIHSNIYFSEMNKLRLENLGEIIDQTDKEIAKLDSLQKKMYFRSEDVTRLREGQLIFTNEPETKLYHTDLLTLVVNKQENQRELTIHSSIISVLEDFTVSEKPTNSLYYYAKKFVPIFFSLAYLLIIVLAFRKDISRLMLEKR